MDSANKYIEKIIGPMTFGRLLRSYRTRHDLSIQELAGKLKVTKGFISNIETGKKMVSLEKCIEIATKLKQSKKLYALIWFEEQARNAGLDLKDILRKAS